MALELQRGVGQARPRPRSAARGAGSASRSPCRSSSRQLRLPRIEREMAERAGRHDRVGARLHRLLDRLDELAERGLLARLDDREPAALELRRVVDRLAAAGLDDPLERRGRVGILEPEHPRRTEDLAAVEGRDLEPLQPLVRRLLELREALLVGELPEQVADVDVLLVGRGRRPRAGSRSPGRGAPGRPSAGSSPGGG